MGSPTAGATAVVQPDRLVCDAEVIATTRRLAAGGRALPVVCRPRRQRQPYLVNGTCAGACRFPAQLGNQIPLSSSFVQALEQLHLPGVVHGMTRDAQDDVEALFIRQRGLSSALGKLSDQGCQPLVLSAHQVDNP